MHGTCLHPCPPLRHGRDIAQKGGERRQAVKSRESPYLVSSTSTCSLSMTGFNIPRAILSPRGAHVIRLIADPHRTLGTPMTAASTTNTCVSSVCSISTALIVHPAEM